MEILSLSIVYDATNLKIQGARRADNFSKMAVTACLKSCEKISLPTQNTGIIVATQFGHHAVTFKLLDNLLTYSDKKVSPTAFAHTVHNSAASYISMCLGIHGPTLTLTCFQDPAVQALKIAQMWLSLNRAEYVIACYAEEKSEPFDSIEKHCDLPSYSKKGITQGAAAILLGKGQNFKPPDIIHNPFKYFEKLSVSIKKHEKIIPNYII